MKKYTFIFFISFLSIHFDVKAQTPYVSWEHNFPQLALIMSLTSKSDNSIIYSGRTSPYGIDSCFGGSHFISIWLGNSNNLENSFSNYCFSSEDSSFSIGIKIIPENDTLYDVFGFTNDTALFGAKNHSNQNASTDIYHLKVNSNGIVRSCRLYGSPGNEQLNSVQKSNDGGWIIGATSDDTGDDVRSHYWSTTTSFPTTDDWIVKLDSSGNIQWSDIIGGTGYQYNPMVIQGKDGYYYLCSWGTSHDNDLANLPTQISSCVFVIKLDSSGNKKEIGLYGGFPSGGVNAGFSQLNNGKLIFTGYSDALLNWNADSVSNGSNNLWVVELDTSLQPVWYHIYGTNAYEETQCADNIIMSDGSIIVAGELNNSDIYLIRIDSSNGHLLWADSIAGILDSNNIATTYITDGISSDTNGIMLCGYTNATSGVFGDSLGGVHSFLIEVSNVTGIPPSPIVQEDYNLSVYPNPFSQSATLKLDNGNSQHWQFTLQDLLGRTVAKYTNDGQISLTISRSNLPAGLYIGIAKDDEGNMLGKTKIVVQ